MSDALVLDPAPQARSVAAERVLVLNDFCHVQGGASKVAVDEAVSLAEEGLDVTFLGAVGPVCDQLRDARVRVVCLGQPELAEAAKRPEAVLQALWNRTAYSKTLDILGGMGAAQSIVHLHGYTKALTTSPALAARKAGFTTVCTLHDFFPACPNGAFYDYRRQEPCQRRALSASCITASCDKRHPAHKAYRVVRGLAQRHYAGFPGSVRDYITLSRRSAALLRPYLPEDAALYPLENVIDVPHGPPVNVGANATLAVLGRLDAEKGVELAAAAARAAGMPITFIGEGPLRAAVEALGGHVTGWLPPARVQEELSRARCLLFPSLWYETYGLVVSEAAARGIPAIVSDISAAAERVEDGVTGWHFRSGDRADLVRRLALLRDDATVAAAGGAAYRRFWENPSDRRSHARDLTAIYGRILARGRS